MEWGWQKLQIGSVQLLGSNIPPPPGRCLCAKPEAQGVSLLESYPTVPMTCPGRGCSAAATGEAPSRSGGWRRGTPSLNSSGQISNIRSYKPPGGAVGFGVGVGGAINGSNVWSRRVCLVMGPCPLVQSRFWGTAPEATNLGEVGSNWAVRIKRGPSLCTSFPRVGQKSKIKEGPVASNRPRQLPRGAMFRQTGAREQLRGRDNVMGGHR